MVDQDKMFYPENRSVQLQLSDDSGQRGSFSIKNIICENIQGSETAYEDGKGRYCRFLDFYVETNYLLAVMLVQNTICEGDGSFACDLGIFTTSAIVGQFRENGIPAFCEEMFDNIWNSCEGTGGAGELWAASEDDADGVEFGAFQAQFYFHDEGAVCEVVDPDVEQVCKIEDFS
jgi:hypothetical protein